MEGVRVRVSVGPKVRATVSEFVGVVLYIDNVTEVNCKKRGEHWNKL